MIINGQLVGVEDVKVRLERAPQVVLTELRKEISILTTDLHRKSREQYLGGGALNVSTGAAQESVQKRVSVNAWSIIGSVSSKSHYLSFWEHGYRVKEHDIISKKGMMYWSGAKHPVSRVHVKARQEAARPSFVPALSEMAVRIRERLGPIAAEVM